MCGIIVAEVGNWTYLVLVITCVFILKIVCFLCFLDNIKQCTKLGKSGKGRCKGHLKLKSIKNKQKEVGSHTSVTNSTPLFFI
jgi:hypothetical protein